MTKFIRLPEVMARTGLSRSGIYASIAEGTFPAQIPLGIRAVAWDSDAVNRWMEQRAAAAKDHASMGISAAAEVLDVHPDDLMQLIDSGDLPSFRMGRHQLVRKTALTAFQRRRARAPSSVPETA